MSENGSVEINVEDVVRELTLTPLGQALWESAQGRVVMRKQAETIAALQRQLNSGKAE